MRVRESGSAEGRMSDQSDKKQPIKVVDRRSFTPEGKPREEPAGEERPEGAVPDRPPEEAGDARPADPVEGSAEVKQGDGFTMETPPDAGAASAALDAAFVNHCVSLYQIGCVHLGLVQEEGDPEPEVNLDAARTMIDVLHVLKTKTQGNLTDEERRILEALLAELQMAYVMKTKEPGA